MESAHAAYYGLLSYMLANINLREEGRRASDESTGRQGHLRGLSFLELNKIVTPIFGKR